MTIKTYEPLQGIPLIVSSIALSIAILLTVLDYSIANVATPYIAGSLAVTVDQGTFVITAFAVGNAIVLPITGWLTKRIGLVQLVFFSLIGFALFSFICGSSFTLPMLVISRFFQGLASGALIPTSQSLMVLIFSEEKRAKALAIWSTIVIIGPILGPILGGWIAYDFGWPWIFYLNIPLAIFSALIVKTILSSHETERERPKADWIGLILLVIAVISLQFSLDTGQEYDWFRSRIIRATIPISFIAFTYLFVWEWYTKECCLEVRLLKIKTYAISILTVGVNYTIYFGSLILIPLWVQQDMGYTPLQAGLAIAPIGILPLAFSWTMEKFCKKAGCFTPLLLGNLLLSFSCFVTAYMNTDASFWWIAFTRLLFGGGIALFVVPIFTLCLMDLPKEKYPSGTGLFHFVQAITGGIGTAVFTTLWIRRSAFHHANIVSTILPTNQPANEYYRILERIGTSAEQLQFFINDVASRQASVLGLNDAFFLMGWIFFAMIPIIIVAKRKKKHAKTHPLSSDSTTT